jgi:D-sedoheptulose 7-phosphate isomerase
MAGVTETASLCLEDHFAEAGSKRDFATRYLNYLSDLLGQLDVGVIEQIIDAFTEAGERGQTVYFIGNGGSAATASHFANDLAYGTRAAGRRPFTAVSLADNVSVLTALANDEGYDQIFVRQLEGALEPGDVVVALSVSGNSANVLEAVRYAGEVGALTIGCTGFDGGVLRQMVDVNLHVPTRAGEYAPVEDVFQILDHLIYSYLRMERRGRLGH